LIELGQRQGSASRVAKALSGAAGTGVAILVLVWLIRGPLDLYRYSYDLLASAGALLFVSFALRTKTRVGPMRAASSFLGNVAWASVASIIGIWLGSWIGGASFPAAISDKVVDLAILMLSTGIVAIGLASVTKSDKRIRAKAKPVVVSAGTKVMIGPSTLSVASDTVALPVVRKGRPFGDVLFGDLVSTFDTPMGEVSSTVRGPLVLRHVPFSARKTDGDEAAKITGRPLLQLASEAEQQVASLGLSSQDIDIPFVHIHHDEGEDESDVDVPFVRVQKDGDESNIRVGPLNINVDESDRPNVNITTSDDDDDEVSHHKRRHGDGDDYLSRSWSAIGRNGSTFVRSRLNGVSARWNGSSMTLRRGFMKMTSGGDAFEYDPQDIRTQSPMHTLHVTQTGISLNTAKFTVKIDGNRVILRTDGKTTSTEDATLASNLRGVLAELARKQVQDVIDGLPIDLAELLSKTEEVLGRHE